MIKTRRILHQNCQFDDYCWVFTVFAPHVDDQRQWVSDTNWTTNPIAGGAVPVPDFHITFWR